MTAARTACALVVLLLVAAGVEAQADSIQVQSARLLADTAPQSSDGSFTFNVKFTVTEAREAYFKTVPTPWNPAVENGTAGESGWWTGVELLTTGTTVASGETDGNELVEFGVLDPQTPYEAIITLHAPGAALGEPQRHEILYALALRGTPDGNTSGGQYDESLSLRAALLVLQPPTDGTVADSRDPWWTPIANNQDRIMQWGIPLGVIVLWFGPIRALRVKLKKQNQIRWARDLSDEELEAIRSERR